jgi:hypothetical protein
VREILVRAGACENQRRLKNPVHAWRKNFEKREFNPWGVACVSLILEHERGVCIPEFNFCCMYVKV